MSTVHILPHRTRSREPLVCLHSSGSSGRQWRAIAEVLAARHDVFTPELLGYDSRDAWPMDASTSLDAEAQALAPLLARAPAHLLGHSYGGAVALQMALRWPERVLSLTLYEPVRFALLLRDTVTAAAGADIVAVGRDIGAATLSGMSDAAAELFVDYWSGAGAWRRMPAARQAVLTSRMSKVRAEFEALFADAVPLSAYGALRMPVHLISGSRSPQPARQVVGLLAAQIPHSVHTRLEGLGHMGPVEDAQRVLAAFEHGLGTQATRAEAA
jgi:pimeloyl-ACP methyl ester carboxylesterase